MRAIVFAAGGGYDRRVIFVLSKLFWLVAAPANLLLILLAAGVLLWRSRRRRRRRLGRRLVGLVTVLLAAVAVLPVGDWALLPLEDRFPQLTRPPARVDGIVVLGGMSDEVLSVERGQPALSGAAERLTVFVALMRRYPQARAVFTGGSARLPTPGVKESIVARAVLGELGVAPNRVLYEEDSRNTHENAVFTRRLVRPEEDEAWILVTSAAHMPRAVGTFRRAGWSVIPYPVDYQTDIRYGLRLHFDLLDGLTKLAFAEKEWIGLAVYRLLGRSDSWFPAPRS